MFQEQKEEIDDLKRRLKTLENRLGNVDYDMRGVVRAELTANSTVVNQAEMQFGVYTALCIETIDIWKQNRIRYFCPIWHNPKSPIKKLPWAMPVSAMGGFDDSGLNWVPPAGSTVCLLFEAGSRASAFYIGTTWQRNRGPQGQHNWGINIPEYYKIWEGHRKGYMVGPNDESQVFPPWNTESYNGFDLTSILDFADKPEVQKLITYPNIYGFKTPEKHMIKMVDGDPKCNRKWKRFEIMSGCGNWIMMKDDHLHYAGQWSHPECGVPDDDVSCVEGIPEAPEPDRAKGGLQRGSTGTDNQGGENTDAVLALIDEEAKTFDITPKEGQKKENTECEGNVSNRKIIGGHPSTGHPKTKHYKKQKGANPYFKNQNECRPYRGPGTPQNNTCDLPQTGIQFMSISGHTFVMDDSVEEPQGNPEWERSMTGFDFGCNNHYVGRCVGANEYITLSDGSRLLAGNLCNQNFTLPDIDEIGNFRVVSAIAMPNIVEPVYKITLDNGHQIIRNSEHPLWKMQRNKITYKSSKQQRKGNVLGWTACGQIAVGDFVAIANSLPYWGNYLIPEDDAKLLGYLIGDGGFTGVNVKFSQQDNKQLEELKSIVINNYNCHVTKLGEYDYHIASNTSRNLVISLLKKHDLMGCHSRDKKVPSAIFRSSKKITSIFLSRLFSTDGWASFSENGCAQIGFCSISKKLIKDVSHLCQKFGIHGKIRFKKNKPSKIVKKLSSAWVFEILKSEDIVKFANEIGIYGKESVIEEIIAVCKKRKHNRKWMYDQLPKSLRWSKVVKIEQLEPELTIAIQVPKTHTFLTEIWEHNTYWKSATGHSIEMSDVESPQGDPGRKLRGEENYIRFKTATGNFFEMNDHTVPEKDCPGSPPNIAGEKRGFTMRSTSNHSFEMIDHTNEQSSPCRSEGGAPTPKAKKAFVKIRTGYGLEILMKDQASQEETQKQHIQIFCPQYNNKERGPHIHRYQEAPNGPGLVFLRVGGNYVVATYDNHLTVVGDFEKNPSNLIELVSKFNFVYTKDVYINVSDQLHLFYNPNVILLLAGKECSPPPNSCDCGGTYPCVGPVCVYDPCNGVVRLSSKVIGSYSQNDPCLILPIIINGKKCPHC